MNDLLGLAFDVATAVVAGAVALFPDKFMRTFSAGRRSAADVRPRTLMLFRLLAGFVSLSLAITVAGEIFGA
jgi:hypothetical protein